MVRTDTQRVRGQDRMVAMVEVISFRRVGRRMGQTADKRGVHQNPGINEISMSMSLMPMNGTSTPPTP